MNHRPELLAPAGEIESAYAAFHYGADAVYLGLRRFSARAEAVNFSPDDLGEITAYAHSLAPRRRVFVTVNTLVLQDELDDLVEALGLLSEIGVDALIVQDLGVFRIARRHFPKMELHASTQMAAHNLAGAVTLRKLGFRRVTLARELTVEEIREITLQSGIETEVFVHGALCYSYSGLCLFSSLLRDRSGNRGKCAYPCRDIYRLTSSPEAPSKDGRGPCSGYAFSMKDLAIPDEVLPLREVGVSCFKIEGRKKSPLYVAAVSKYYRQILDAGVSARDRDKLEEDLQTVFSRPWTRLYSRSRFDRNVVDAGTVGHRGAPVGLVESVIGTGTGIPRLRFKTFRDLERHDGLQIDLPEIGKPFGFAVDSLKIVGKGRGVIGGNVFEAPAGSVVEVALPKETPPIPVGAPVYCSSSQQVKRDYRYSKPKPGQFRIRYPLEVTVAIAVSELNLRLRTRYPRAGDQEVEITQKMAGPFEKTKDPAKMQATARQSFEKLGDTRFCLDSFAWNNPEDLFVRVSALNELRRRAIESLDAALETAKDQALASIKTEMEPPAIAPSPIGQKESWLLKTDRVEHLAAFEEEDWRGVAEVVIDIGNDAVDLLENRLRALSERPGRDSIRLALPIITRKWEESSLREKIQRLRSAGWNKWEAANMSAWTYLGLEPQAGLPGPDLSTDWPVYVVNRQAALQAFEMGAGRVMLSPEDGLGNIRPLLAEFGSKAGVIVYQDTPLFISESCAYANLANGCAGRNACRFEKMELGSSAGEALQVLNAQCRTVAINERPLCLSSCLGKLREAGAGVFRADFIHRRYEPADVVRIWRQVRAGENVARTASFNFLTRSL